MGRGQARRRNLAVTLTAGLMILGMAALACSQQGTGVEDPDREQTAGDSLLPSEISAPTQTATRTVTASATATPNPGSYFDEDHNSRVGYLLPLTVQFCSNDDLIIYFELEQPSAGFIFYRQESTPLSDAFYLTLNPEETIHLLTLDGLQPDTVYQIDVGLTTGDGRYGPPAWRGEPWGAVSVKTLAENPEQLRIGIIGDSGFGEEVTYKLGRMMASSDLDFVIHTGDVVYKMEEQSGDPFLAYWLKYYLPFKPVLQHMVLYPVPGNHEYNLAAMWEELPFYYHVFPSHPGIDPLEQGIDGQRRWYAIEIGEIQFLMIDSEAIYGAPGRAEMQAWLEERLRDDRFDVTIPVFHIPPFTSGIYTEEGIPFQQLWHQLFVEAGVPLVLSGHDHNYQRLLVDGITYLISGGGSTVLYAMDEPLPQSQFFQRISHYVVLEVESDTLELRAVSYEGEQLDQAVIQLP
ncbi:MAG: metallophosphoesterase [Anaerolineales bacterium]|nr:metallophosphoesterase [Anaerolineales bacterium]